MTEWSGGQIGTWVARRTIGAFLTPIWGVVNGSMITLRSSMWEVSEEPVSIALIMPAAQEYTEPRIQDSACMHPRKWPGHCAPPIRRATCWWQ